MCPSPSTAQRRECKEAERVTERTWKKHLQRCHLGGAPQSPGGLTDKEIIEIMTVGDLGLWRGGEWGARALLSLPRALELIPRLENSCQLV